MMANPNTQEPLPMLFTLESPDLSGASGATGLQARVKASLMGSPLQVEFANGDFEHRAKIYWVFPCCSRRPGSAWEEEFLHFSLLCPTCGTRTGQRFHTEASCSIFVAVLWEKGVGLRYCDEMTYTEEAREWLCALLEADGASPLSIGVASENLIEELVRILQTLPLPSSTADPAGWA